MKSVFNFYKKGEGYMFTANDSNYNSSQLEVWGVKEVSPELIRKKRCDLRWLINHYQEIIDEFESLSNFNEDEPDYPMLSLAYNNTIEIQHALMLQYEQYPYKLDAATRYDV